MRIPRVAGLIVAAILLCAPGAVAEDQGPLALLWLQKSAEARALCKLVYNTATRAVAERVRLSNYGRNEKGQLVSRVFTRIGTKYREDLRPVAVVMDLDETVLDNSPFEAYLVKAGKGFDDSIWRAFVRFQGSEPRAHRAIPGAVDFIRTAEALGVTVIYISNRDTQEGQFDAVLRILKGIGVGEADLANRVLLHLGKEEEKAAALKLLGELGLAQDGPVGRALLANQSKKERRRLITQLQYHVIGWFGDDLNDFPIFIPKDTAKGPPMLEARSEAVSAYSGHWGTDFFVLPNPIYGSWRSSLPDKDSEALLEDAGFGEFMRGK
ncbi:MAG: hypothetical protein FJX76_11965 [Armatimonadetes bacterium]|nr:hypothetical protein [Armatimonadota bacterium]